MTNMTPLTDEQRELAERHFKLAMWMAKKVSWQYPRFRDEIDSAAMFGLVSAARSFDPSRGMSFTTLARIRITSAIWNASRETDLKGFVRRRGQDGYPRLVSIAQIIDCADEESPNDLDETDSFDHLISGLPEGLRDVIRPYYLGRKTMAGIATMLGISQSEVCRRHTAAIRYLSPDGSHHKFTRKLRKARLIA